MLVPFMFSFFCNSLLPVTTILDKTLGTFGNFRPILARLPHIAGEPLLPAQCQCCLPSTHRAETITFFNINTETGGGGIFMVIYKYFNLSHNTIPANISLSLKLFCP